VIWSGQDAGSYDKVPVHLGMHVTSATVGFNGIGSIIATGFVRGFGNLVEQYDDVLVTAEGQTTLVCGLE
jgi:hypothetical protein